MKDEIDKLIYDSNKEIIKNDGNIKISFDDKKETITFDISEDFEKSLLKSTDLDEKSIVKAPSTNKYYCKALSEPNSQTYYGIEDIKSEIKNATNNYKKILDESSGSYSDGWIFNYKVTVGYKYFFVIDSNPILRYARPVLIEIIIAPFKINEWLLNYPVLSDNEGIGIINFVFNPDLGHIKINSKLLDKDSEITIYESENKVF